MVAWVVCRSMPLLRRNYATNLIDRTGFDRSFLQVMRIALIAPKGTHLAMNRAFSDFWRDSAFMESYRLNWSGIGSALPTIASLTPSPHEVVILDESMIPLNSSQEYDLVGISTMTQQATRAYELADTYRRSGVPVVMGGIHASVLPAEAAKHADAVVVGEAEQVWAEVVADAECGRLKRKYEAEGTTDITQSPTPRYDLLRGNASYPVIWVESSRGCPHDCEFCAASRVFGRRYRNKNIHQVLDALTAARRSFPDCRIGFADDNMFVDKKRAKRLLDALRPEGLRWAGQTDIAVAEDEELLGRIAASGCTFLFIGFESLSEGVLTHIDPACAKAKRLHRYGDLIAAIQSHGIGVMGAFIVGFDEDGPETFDRIVDFVNRTHMYETQISILTPLPGTRIRERLEQEGRLLQTGWDHYTVFDANFVPLRFSSPEELEQGLLRAYQLLHTDEVYLRRLAHFKELNKRRILAARAD